MKDDYSATFPPIKKLYQDRTVPALFGFKKVVGVFNQSMAKYKLQTADQSSINPINNANNTMIRPINNLRSINTATIQGSNNHKPNLPSYTNSSGSKLSNTFLIDSANAFPTRCLPWALPFFRSASLPGPALRSAAREDREG